MVDISCKQRELLCILSNRIRERRKMLGFTQEKLAELAGISVNYLARMEMISRTPSFDTLVRIADALDVEVYELLKNSNSSEETEYANEIIYYLGVLTKQQAEFLLQQIRDTAGFLKSSNKE